MCCHSVTFAAVLNIPNAISTEGLTIIVPVYNERESIPTLVNELKKFLETTSIPASVLFVNDGSNDGGDSLLNELCKSHDKLQVAHFEENAGLSAAIKAGFDLATTTWIGYMDADLQTTPMDFDLLWSHRADHGLITGIREKRKDAPMKRFSSWFANSFRQLFTGDGVSDTGCPLKLIRADVAKRIPMFKGLHRFLPAMVLLQDETIYQTEVRHFPRAAGQSKFHVMNRLIGPLTDCFAFLWMKRKYIRYKIKTHE